MAQRRMTLAALGLGGGRVRVEITSVDAGMSVDLDRESALRYAAAVLLQAGVTSMRVGRDGAYQIETEA